MDLVLGSRYTTNSEAGGSWSPQTTLLIKPGDFRGRFTYIRGFRSPRVDELSSSFIEEASQVSSAIPICRLKNRRATPEISNTISNEPRSAHRSFVMRSAISFNSSVEPVLQLNSQIYRASQRLIAFRHRTSQPQRAKALSWRQEQGRSIGSTWKRAI